MIGKYCEINFELEESKHLLDKTIYQIAFTVMSNSSYQFK